jgi:hypothetical protein
MKTTTDKQEKMQRLRAYAKRIKTMTPDALRAMIRQAGAILTIEGNALSDKNTALIIMQRQTATVVGGYQQWRKAGRMVRKGERGASIFIPCRRKAGDDDGEELFFATATVFDISQTAEIGNGGEA